MKVEEEASPGVTWESVYRIMKKRGKPVPEPPDLFFDLFDVWNAFIALHTRRDVTMAGIAAISEQRIESWLNIHGIFDQESRQEYYRLITRLDDQWRRSLNNKNKRQEQTHDADSKSSNRRKGGGIRRKTS